jgi:hypothetical protein
MQDRAVYISCANAYMHARPTKVGLNILECVIHELESNHVFQSPLTSATMTGATHAAVRTPCLVTHVPPYTLR